jgi:hypothetical protein
MTTVDASGNVSLPGAFYGDYQAIINGKNYNFTFDPNGNNIVVTAALTGDFNSDGVVDAADYVAWRTGLGTIYTQSDYNVWRENFGNVLGTGTISGTSIPEPGLLVLLFIGAICTGSAGRSPMGRH